MTGIEKVARRRAAALVLALLAPLGGMASTAAPAGALPACSRSWAAPVSGSWSDPTKWTGGIVPLPTDHVCIFGAATFTVTLAGPGAEVASLRLGEHGGTHTQELAVVPGVTPTTLLAHEEIDVGKHGLLTLGSPAGGAGTVAVRTDPDGRIDILGEVSAPADPGTLDTALELATGQLRFYANHPSFPPPGTLRVERPLSITADQILLDGVVDLSAPLDVEVATRLWLSGGTISTAGPTAGNPVVTVDGTLRVGGFSVEGTDWETGQFLVTDGGAVEFDGEAEVGVAIEGEVTVSGTVREQTRLLVNGRADGAEAHARFGDTFTNEGEIVLGDDAGSTSQASLGTDGAGTFVNDGHLLVGAAGGPEQVSRILADVTNRGYVELDDPLELLGDLRNEGALDLGAQELAVDPGDVVLAPTSQVFTAITPAIGALGHGRLITDPSGSVAVAGWLQVDTDGDAPAVGATFRVITTGTRTGTFSDVQFQGPASYDTTYGTDRVTLVRRASESASRRFVRAAYQDFLDRQPTATELTQTASALDTGTLTRATLVRQLSLSPEYIGVLVQRFYLDTLKRPGTPTETAYWVDELRSGRQTVLQVAAGFYASGEYIVYQAENRPELWVHRLYGIFFEREPSTSERDYWVGRVRSRGYTQVAKELFQSLESRRQRVQLVYGDLLGRAGDPDGVDYWAGRITREGDLALAVNLAASGEYLDRAQDRYP
ncbi:MAG TPA: DUF4214 domain-containing protein [Iamia sp.]